MSARTVYLVAFVVQVIVLAAVTLPLWGAA